MRKLITFCWFSIVSLNLVWAQLVPQDVQFRLDQIKYIKETVQPVIVTPLPSYINTPYSEFRGELLPDSTFIYSSFSSVEGTGYSTLFSAYRLGRIYSSRLTESGYTSPSPLNSKINSKKYYNINFCFDKSKKRLFFTRCSKGVYPELKCTIWQSDWQDGNWSKPTPLPPIINAPHKNTTQPCWVEYPNYEVLYFVSNRPGGVGGLDIWYSIHKDGEFQQPVNLGPTINTTGDEVTPFYDSENRILYFSSDEHLGIGGYDIFYAYGALNEWEEPTNMGVPFNSEYNDAYLTFYQPLQSGYFSSNRPSNVFVNRECCSDIYHFEWDLPSDTLIAEEPQDTVTIEEKLWQLLPITLYFDNDQPDPKSNKTSTNQNYQQTVSDYIAKKELFMTQYAGSLSGSEASEARREMEIFFRDSIKGGYEQLLLFTKALAQAVESGKNIEITIHGYASPLHKSEYNLKLSSRRIASVINFLKAYQDGLLLPYFDGSKPGRITVVEVPMGSEVGKRKRIEDRLSHKRESVYGIAASKERKIKIIAIEIE
ncbi:MAG TPA: hypothetical protein GX007_02170 [Bacteroidales bacterium]|jgi:outer membrane protein OmpA-like peptidoglycan-associated protein|nr:hypothetical protein [Bacteroidales bacterium]